jgi:hypothetical protein
MTDRVFEDDRNFEVSGVGGCSVEVYVFAGKDVMIAANGNEDAGWASQRANFIITAEEATMLKEFLIRKGY